MEFNTWKKAKQFGKRLVAITLVVIVLSEMVQPAMASTLRINEGKIDEINLLTTQNAGFSGDIYERVTLQGEKKSELVAFTLLFDIKKKEANILESTIPVESEFLAGESEELRSTEPESIETESTEVESVETESTDSVIEEVEVTAPSYNEKPLDGAIEMETFTLSLPFSEFYTINEDMKSGEIVLENDGFLQKEEIIGTFKIEREGEQLYLKGGINVPKYREEAYQGKITFYLDMTNPISELSIFWDEANQMVSGKEGAKNISVMRTPMVGQLRATNETKIARPILPGESKEIEINIKEALAKNAEYAKYAAIYKSAKMILTTTRGSQTIRVKMDAVLDDTYLGNGFEEILGNFDENENLQEYLQNPETYKDLLALELPFQFGDVFTTIDGTNITVGLTVGGDKENDQFGYYKLINSAVNKGIVEMLCALDKKLYTKTDVTIGFSYDLLCTQDIEADEIYDLKEENGKIVCATDNIKVSVNGDPATAGEYTLNKTILSSNEKDPYVTYQIEVKSYDIGGINKGVIEDVLPLGGVLGGEYPLLSINRVFLKTDKGSRTELTEGEGTNGTYKIVDGKKLQITFPEHGGVKNKMITRVLLEIETMLTPPAMLAMNKSELKFTNKAEFEIPNSSLSPLEATSPEVKKQYSVFEKTGRQNNQNASWMDWTIHFNAAFTGKPQVYLIDTLDPTVHDYIDLSNITLQIKKSDGTQSIETLNLKKSSETGKIYEEVTVEELDAYRQNLGGNTVKAFSYQATNGTHVMVLAISDFLSASGKEKQQESIAIEYTTQIAEGTSAGSAKIKNSADIRWQYAGGNGIGPGWTPDFDFGLDREETITLGTVSKRASSYDEKTQKQKWLFDINAVRQDVGYVVIKEDFTTDPASQILPDDLAVTIEKIHSKKQNNPIIKGEIPKGSSGVAFPYYELSTDKKSIQIFLGTVTKEDNFVVSLTTKVSGAVTSKANPDGNNPAVAVSNKAFISTNGGTNFPESVTASVVVPNTLIQKEAIKYGSGESSYSYNFATNEMQWKVTANPNALTIEEAMVTDLLPEHTTFGRVTALTYGTEKIEATGSTSLITIPTTPDAIERSSNSITVDGKTAYLQIKKVNSGNAREQYEFQLVDATKNGPLPWDKPLILEFTTGLTQAYRDRVFSLNETSQEYENIETDGKLDTSFKNEVTLTGGVKDSSSINRYTVNSGASATHDIALKTLEKSATYDSVRPGIIQWMAVINQGKGTMNGKTLKDKLPNDLSLEFNTDSKSYGLYEGIVAEDGTITLGSKITTPTITLGAKELEIAFPDTKGVYVLKFETYITDDAKLADMKNKLTLFDNSGNILTSNTENPSGGGSFSMNDYATAKESPILMIEKVSSNEDASALNNLKLKDVEFQIFEQEYNAGAWTDVTGSSNKIKVTKDNGKQIFVNFKMDTLYRIKESKAAEGYDTCADIYIYWLSDGGTKPTDGKTAPNSVPIEVNAKKSTFKKLVVKNTPKSDSSGEIKFKKIDEKGNSLKNVTFELKHKANMVGAVTKTTGLDGFIVFEKVDPGEYILTEVSVDDPYQKAAKPFAVTKTGTSFVITGENATGDAISGYKITNKLAKTELKITKVDSNTKTQKLKDARFELSGEDYFGDPILLPKAGDTNITGEEGTVTIKDIPPAKSGTYYTLTETAYPTGYKANQTNPTQYKVYVTVKNNQPNIKITTFDDAITLSEKEEVTLENVPNFGSITFIKKGTSRKNVDGTDGSDIFLEKAKFGLYASTTASQPVTDKNGQPAVVESDENGKVEFKDISFGNYVIKEISAPTGYQKSDKVISVTTEAMQAATAGAIFTTDATTKETTFSYSIAEEKTKHVQNVLAQIPLQLKKTDQNEELLENVEFSIQRWGSASEINPVYPSAYMEYEVDKPVNSTKKDTVKTDENGIANFGNVIYGTYKIEEKITNPEVISNDKPFFITVAIVNNAIQVKSYADDPMQNIGAIGTDVPFSEGRYLLTVINKLKYGVVQIKKAVGTKIAGNSYDVVEENGSVILLEDALFEIYHETQINDDAAGNITLKGNQTPYLSLKTDSKGQFNYETRKESEDFGKYLDVRDNSKKQLLIGTYYLKEKEAPIGYIKDEKFYKFAVQWDADLTTPTTVFNAQKDGVNYFVNEMVRAEVLLTKTDEKTHSKLSGAEFLIYQRGETTPVAGLREVDAISAKGQYTLYKPSNVTLNQANAQGIPYLKQENGKWKLLSGSYDLIEEKAPKGYETLKEADRSKKRISFEIKDDSAIILKNPSTNPNNEFTNKEGMQNLSIQKKIQEGSAGQVVPTTAQLSVSGFSFTLNGIPDREGTSFTERKVTTDVNGVANFSNIPYGSYTLEEKEPADGRAGNYILVSTKEIEILEAGIRIKDASSMLLKDTNTYVLEATNELRRGKITGSSVGYIETFETDLSGVVIGLYEDLTGTKPFKDKDGKEITTVTDTKGNYEFNNLPYAVYYVKQTAVPDGFALDTKIETAQLNAAVVTLNVFKNSIYKAQVQLQKTDATTNALSGAEFAIYGNEKPMEDVLVAYLLETTTPGTYKLYDAKDGITLPQTKGSKNLPCYVESNGVAYLTSGYYKMKELKAPEYYQIDKGEYPLSVDKGKDGTTINLKNLQGALTNSFVNTRIPADISFRKVYKVREGLQEFVYGVSQAEFTLYKNQACTDIYKTVESDGGTVTKEPGDVLFTGVEPGTYYMKETKVPNLFTASVPDTIYQIVTDGNKTEPVITVLNTTQVLTEIDNEPSQELLKTTLEVILTGSDGSIIRDAEFQIYRNGILFMTAKTNSNGRLRRASVPPGNYTIRQLSSNNGFLPNSLPGMIEVKIGENVLFPVVNHKSSPPPSQNKEGGQSSTEQSLRQQLLLPEEIEQSIVPLNQLPKTGGMGMEATGLALGLAMMVIGCKKVRRKKEKEIR